MLFFNRVAVAFAASALLMLTAPLSSATEAEDRLVSVGLMMECPEARYISVKGGKVTWYRLRSEPKDVAGCVRRAYWRVVAELKKGCPDARATLRDDGKLVLSC